MSFLRRMRLYRPPKTPQDADKLALRQLETRGADLSLPRHVIHFLLFEHEADARAAADAIDGGSWTTRVDPPTQSLEEWSVRVDGHRVVGADTVAAFRAQFEQIAAAHGGEYDGWEASAKP
jgi:Regulator of ribonuclease activity B